MDFFVYAAAGYVLVISKLLGHRIMQDIGDVLGALLYYPMKKLRKRAVKNILYAGVVATEREARKLTAKMFGHLVKLCFEIIHFSNCRYSTLKFVRVANLDVLKWVREKYGSSVLIFGHHGNWELGACLSLYGYTISPVIRPPASKALYAILTAMRRSKLAVPVEKYGAADYMIKFIKAGRFVSIDMDQNAGGQGVRVKFFGKDVSCWKTPAILSLRLKVPVVPVKVVRKNMVTRLIINDPIMPDVPPGEADKITFLTQKYVNSIETHIKDEPYQWLWMLNRWKDDSKKADRKREIAAVA